LSANDEVLLQHQHQQQHQYARHQPRVFSRAHGMSGKVANSLFSYMPYPFGAWDLPYGPRLVIGPVRWRQHCPMSTRYKLHQIENPSSPPLRRTTGRWRVLPPYIKGSSPPTFPLPAHIDRPFTGALSLASSVHFDTIGDAR
jgi:hypothetical protein